MATSSPPEIVIPATPSSKEILFTLFSAVGPPPSALSPARMPNLGPKSTTALLAALRDNHERSHVFFNDFSFHNHSAHHLLAIYALGAPASLITVVYQDIHLDHMRTAFVAPNKVTITDDNFTDYLGNHQYYNAYLDYFHRVVLDPCVTVSSILEKYIFSPRYNVRTPEEGANQPQMLNRLFEILIHPIIHVGCGAEFGIIGLIAEGLAWTAVHPAGATTLVTRLLFTPARVTPISDLEKQEPEWMPKPGSRLRALNILSLMRRDPRFFGSKVLEKQEYAAMLQSHGELINAYAEFWDCHIENQKDLEARVEELVWMAALIYGVGSWDGPEAEYRADFFTAHIVTSALFIPSICAYLSRPSQTKLLRAHFLTSITWWLVRGRPGFQLQAFTSQPLPPQPHPLFTDTACPALSSSLSSSSKLVPLAAAIVTPNPWYPILANALAHPNEHLCKVQRALAHFNVLYGHREAGFVLASLSADVVVADPEYAYLDGTVFLRVAWLTADRLGWVIHGEEDSGVWAYEGFEHAAMEQLFTEGMMRE